ncbi:MAG: hypothetical protein CMP59_08190 [Flavobacteriales bacterium]|nr:hypothetical protein [Flavobacteriales bacterium]
MMLYGFSGLGADKRVFKYLNLDAELIAVEWIQPLKDESIEEYAKRLSESIDQSSDYGFLGVSFGGLIAVELSKILDPKITILISSVETKNDLRYLYRKLGNSNLLKVVPSKIIKPPKAIAQFLFGAENTALLDQIIQDTDPIFLKWALNQLLKWQNKSRHKNCYKIHGTNDKLIPLPKDDSTFKVEGGGHFMIVDRADEVSAAINKILKMN